MGARWTPTDEHRRKAVQRVLAGLGRGDDVFTLAKAVEDLHPPNNTFPGEVFLRLATDALDAAAVTQERPIRYEGLRETFLPECQFRGRENRKIQFAVLAVGAGRGGVEPDLLDEVVWWQTDDFWWFALAASVAIIRSCAERQGESVPVFAERLAEMVSASR